MKNIIFTMLAFVLTLSSFSQEDCNCEQALSQLIEKVESDYPGFKEKTTYELIYSNFKDGLIIKAQGIPE